MAVKLKTTEAKFLMLIETETARTKVNETFTLIQKDIQTPLLKCMYVCKIYLTSVKNVIIIKSNIYNTNLNRPRQKGIITVALTNNSINEDPKELQDPQ